MQTQTDILQQHFGTPRPKLADFCVFWENYRRDFSSKITFEYRLPFMEICKHEAIKDNGTYDMMDIGFYMRKVFFVLYEKFIGNHDQNSDIDKLCADVQTLSVTSHDDSMEDDSMEFDSEDELDGVEIGDLTNVRAPPREELRPRYVYKEYDPVPEEVEKLRQFAKSFEESKNHVKVTSMNHPQTFKEDPDPKYFRDEFLTFEPVPNHKLKDFWKKALCCRHWTLGSKISALKAFKTSKFELKVENGRFVLVEKSTGCVFRTYDDDKGIWSCENNFIQLQKFDGDWHRRYMKVNGRYYDVMLNPDFLEFFRETFKEKYSVYYFPLSSISKSSKDIQVQNLQRRIQESKRGDPKTFLKFFKDFSGVVTGCSIKIDKEKNIAIYNRESSEFYGVFKPLQGRFWYDGKMYESVMGNLYISECGKYVICVTLPW